MLTLWDLLPRSLRPKPKVVGEPAIQPAPPQRRPSARALASAQRPARATKPAAPAQPAAKAQDRYDAMVRELLAEHGIRVKRWRTSMSGVAWELRSRDGSIARFLESPRPKGPMSAAVFLHEIGHHAIGFRVYKPRCLEEYHAWAWALAEMERRGLAITDRVRDRMHRSLHYAIGKAQRRGLRALPAELLPFAEALPRRRTGRVQSRA